MKKYPEQLALPVYSLNKGTIAFSNHKFRQHFEKIMEKRGQTGKNIYFYKWLFTAYAKAKT